MSWPRGSLLAAFLVLCVPLASANTIRVNTTTDDNASNSLCSLREAVEYFNQGNPTAGYQGCVVDVGTSADSTNTITLASDAAHPYLVASPIYIHKSMTINGAGAVGDTRTIIKATAANRVFVFYDKATFLAASCGLITPAHPTINCSPPGAPVLTGASNFLITDNTPEFSGSLVTAVPAATSSGTVTTEHLTLVRLYQTSATTTTPALVATTVLTAGQTVWTVSTNALPFGDQSIFYTTQNITKTTDTASGTPSISSTADPETAASVATAIRVAPNFTSLSLTINKLDLEGCGLADCAASADILRPGPAATDSYTDTATGLTYIFNVTGTAGKGGIIYGTGALSLDGVTLHGGRASTGGAIYVGTEGGLNLNESELYNNKADHGAAVFVARNILLVNDTLLTENTINVLTAAGAAVIEVDSAASSVGTAVIENTTLSGNTGVALSLLAGSIVNSSTIVLNRGGINFNNASVSVYNSVVAGNPDNFSLPVTATDCIGLPAAVAATSTTAAIPDIQFSVSVTGGGCDADGALPGLTLLANKDSGLAEEKLMASVDAQGHCTGYLASSPVPASFNGMGVLCPLLDNGGSSRTHLIRLLPTYTHVSDSPLMTKGSSCTDVDQRGKARHSPCDIGALELQPLVAVIATGDVITYGHVYTPKDYGLGDEELLDSAHCPVNPPTAATYSQYSPASAGCPWLVKAPTRGTVTFNLDGTYNYTPSSNFHGFDAFTIRVVTTLSRLNSAQDTQSRVIGALVIVEPPSGISSSSLGGALDWGVMILGGGLGLLRLRRKDREK